MFGRSMKWKRHVEIEGLICGPGSDTSYNIYFQKVNQIASHLSLLFFVPDSHFWLAK
jgi:hypothetical protein